MQVIKHNQNLGGWADLLKKGGSFLDTAAGVYSADRTASAAKAASKADIANARAALEMAQSEVERARLQNELAQMEAENRRQFIKDVAPIGLITLVLGGGALYLVRRNKPKKRGRR